jgi:hypothetical protein
MSCARHGGAFVAGLLLSLAAAHGQFISDPNGARSVSGQFLITGAADPTPFFRKPALAADTNLVHLDPALLAVAAERFKLSLWRQLGIASDTAWSGKIFIALHPARMPDAPVTIASSPFLNHWNYRVEMPDTVTKTRFARALSGVLLLELANRNATTGGRSAEVPSWLVDGLAQQVLAADGDKVLLSVPTKKPGDNLPVNRVDADHDFDSLAHARQVLQNAPALTFDQLSWPVDEQMNGLDGGAYFASAQLFFSELKGLRNSPEKLRAFVSELPAHLNWQMAFFRAFHENFQRPLDVEKWWALRVINFAARSPGPRWTSEISSVRLAQLLSVPVEYRNDSNALPVHAEISLQSAMKSLPPAQRDAVLHLAMRDLTLIELRLGPPFGELADGYRLALAGFLGELKNPAPVSLVQKRTPSPKRIFNLAETLKKLDDLDARRRAADSRLLLATPANPHFNRR